MTVTSTPHLLLARNLQAVARLAPRVAAAIAQAAPREDSEFVSTPDGGWTIRTPAGHLASRLEPFAEGRAIAELAPVESAACIVVVGMAAGHHVSALAARVRKTGVILVYEPDLALLRLVFERRDCSAWIDESNVVFVHSDDSAVINSSITGMEGMLAAGVKIIDHPPSRARLGELAPRFSRALATVMAAVKTNVVTTFVQVETTLRNFLMNVDRYATLPGIADLAGAGKGRPAIVVSAGPSLERNIELLARPGVRDRVVIIAAQTVLKKLLAKGIKPHFVTALDYHEISRRFYEGLTPADVEGVTLVVEAKANPAIISAFPGVIRCPAEHVLDELLGAGLARNMGPLTPGATVAHLAYYLGRSLGCDPVILIGQDLGFTDGQYYHAGAAIHRVWAGELNEFNTLEMLEWQRIVRSRAILHQATDQLGRPIYTDEQMATYLVQFERDFAADAARGLWTIDATEGGVAKQHTTVMTLAEALERFMPAEPLALPPAPAVMRDTGRAHALRERLAAVRRDTWKIGELSRKTTSLLESMIQAGSDQRRVGQLIDQTHVLRDEVMKLQPAYGLLSFLNQTGGFKRFQADRAIELDRSLSPLERQKRQIERDITNVTWIADAADQLGSMLDQTLRMLDGGERVTRDSEAAGTAAAGSEASHAAPATRIRCAAFIPAHTCPAPYLGEVVWGGMTALELTLRRLASCAELDGVVISGDAGGVARRIVDAMPGDVKARLRIQWVEQGGLEDSGTQEWSRRATAARRWSAHCWRGGPGNLTIWDELWRPAALGGLMERGGIDAAVLVGPQWCAVDPEIADEVVRRHRENPEQLPITFSPTAPGLAPCVISRELAMQLGSKESVARTFATIGGVLGYVPALPRPDPIAKPPCVETPVELRDLGRRMIADTRDGIELLRAAFAAANSPGVPTRELALAASTRATPVQMLECDLRAGKEFSLPDSMRGWAGRGDSLDIPGLTIIADEAQVAGGAALRASRLAEEAGLHTQHLRLGLAVDEIHARELLQHIERRTGTTIVSVDLVAWSPDTYRRLTGRDGLDVAQQHARRLIRAGRSQPGPAGVPKLWVVPRITRRDEVYAEIEAFYDHWLMEAGACVIDPLPAPVDGARIAPLPPPAWVSELRRMETLCL